MVGEITPDGAFPELFREYIDYKRNLGYVYPNSRLYLVRRLSRFLAERAADERVLTRDAAEAFIRPRAGESAGSVAGRRGIARQFALFLRWKGIQAWVLPEHTGPRRSSSFVPRIITAVEMARIIVCADTRPASRCGPQTQPVYAMLVRLLWCCGLRISEALSLRVGDVDLDEALITVRNTETQPNPAGADVAVVDRARPPLAITVGLVPEDPGAWFFSSPRGAALSPRLRHLHIQQPMLQVGVTTAAGRSPRMRAGGCRWCWHRCVTATVLGRFQGVVDCHAFVGRLRRHARTPLAAASASQTTGIANAASAHPVALGTAPPSSSGSGGTVRNTISIASSNAMANSSNGFPPNPTWPTQRDSLRQAKALAS